MVGRLRGSVSEKKKKSSLKSCFFASMYIFQTRTTTEMTSLFFLFKRHNWEDIKLVLIDSNKSTRVCIYETKEQTSSKNITRNVNGRNPEFKHD